jgi:hypothetical protein
MWIFVGLPRMFKKLTRKEIKYLWRMIFKDKYGKDLT